LETIRADGFADSGVCNENSAGGQQVLATSKRVPEDTRLSTEQNPVTYTSPHAQIAMELALDESTVGSLKSFVVYYMFFG